MFTKLFEDFKISTLYLWHTIELRVTGMTNKQVAEKLDTSEKVIGNWICKFKKEGLGDLLKKRTKR